MYGFAEEARGPSKTMWRRESKYVILERLAPNNFKSSAVTSEGEEVLVEEGTRYEAESAAEDWMRRHRGLR